MPRLSYWFIRASLLNLAAGFTLGALLLAHKGMPLHPALWGLLAPHIEFVLLAGPCSWRWVWHSGSCRGICTVRDVAMRLPYGWLLPCSTRAC
jgi:hypothetical protein